jgi:hypothetical protein
MTEKVNPMVFDPMNAATYSAMQTGLPYKIYQKTTLGKVAVTILNPFSGEPEGVIIEGDPSLPQDQDKITINIWNAKEDVFFKRLNKAHFDAGNLREIPVPRPEQIAAIPRSINDITDEEIYELLSKPFLALKNKLNKFTAPAPVIQILRKAEEMEKSEKILNACRARISELEFSNIPKTESGDKKE